MKHKHSVAFLVSVALILAVTVGGTLAYLVTATPAILNIFNPAQVSCRVEQDLSITNTSDVPAYLRAMVVVNWTKTVDGQTQIAAEPPVLGTDYTITVDGNWTEDANGIYYYKDAVDPTEKISFVTVSQIGTQNDDGYTLTVEVVAEAIQAEGINTDGTTPVKDAWGVTLPAGNNG